MSDINANSNFLNQTGELGVNVCLRILEKPLFTGHSLTCTFVAIASREPCLLADVIALGTWIFIVATATLTEQTLLILLLSGVLAFMAKKGT